MSALQRDVHGARQGEQEQKSRAGVDRMCMFAACRATGRAITRSTLACGNHLPPSKRLLMPVTTCSCWASGLCSHGAASRCTHPLANHPTAVHHNPPPPPAEHERVALAVLPDGGLGQHRQQLFEVLRQRGGGRCGVSSKTMLSMQGSSGCALGLNQHGAAAAEGHPGSETSSTVLR